MVVQVKTQSPMAFIIFLYAVVSIFRGTIAFYDLLEFFKGSRLKYIFGAATLSGTSVGRSLVVEEEDNPKPHTLLGGRAS